MAMISRNSIFKPHHNLEQAEYEKSIMNFKGKPFTPKVTTVKVVTVVQRSKAPSPRAATTPSPRRAPSSLTVKRSPSVSAAPTSSLSSSSTLSPSETTAGASDARLSKLPSASPPPKPSYADQDASTSPQSPENAKDASMSSPLKRERPLDDASPLAEDPQANETHDASLSPSPPKRVKAIRDAPTREATASPTVSAGTSRASSPTTSVKSSTPSAPSKKTRTSRKPSDSGKKTRRRKKRALTDLTLPPKKGTYRRHLDPVTVRATSTPESTTACEFEATDPRQTWTEEDGHVGDRIRTSEQVVKRLSEMGRYIAFFRNPNDPEDKSYELSEHPTIELEYPNTGAVETFLLARPKDEDHYDPTLDIENTLGTFIKDVIPYEYKDLLGPLPEDALRSIADEDEEENNYRGSSAPPESSPFHHASSLTLQAPEPSPFNGMVYPDSENETPPPPTSSARCSPSPRKLMKSLVSARHRKDGPTYTSTLREINRCIRELKDHVSGNILRDVPRTWEMDGIPNGVVHRIIEETYQRCVGPQISQLRKYEAFSSNVYGELTPAFVNDIIERTRLNSKSLFLDLGSGVGNVVLQAALQTGCNAFGIEEREDTARIANDQLEQIKLRCRMWGVSMGEVELVQGDMTKSDRVDQLMSKADVVLVNNYVFSEELNAALRPKFLDLKEGAYVVSLKPFAQPRSHLLTVRNFDDVSAIFDVHQHPYHSGTVSWSSGNGAYYIHHVNREGYRVTREVFQRNRVEKEKRRKTRGAAPELPTSI